MPHLNNSAWKKVLILAAIGVVLLALLFANEQVSALYHAIKDVVSPFVMGATFAFILNVPMRAIERRMGRIKNKFLRRILAITITLLIILIVISLVSYLLVDQILKELWKLSEQLNVPQLQEWITKIANLETQNLESIFNEIVEKLGAGLQSVLTGAFAVIGTISKGIVNLVIAVIFSLYCLFQKETLARQGRKLLYAFFSETHADNVVRIFRLSNNTFANFLSGQCIEVCILGTLFAIIMAIFRMPYILLISSLIAITAFIPMIGALVGCAVGAVLILLDGDPMKAVIFVIMSIVVQQVENNVIYPRVVGNSIGLSGMWVLVAVAVGGALMGPVGMILMIPMASVIQTLLREVTGKRLAVKNVDEEKLKDQPPELRQHIRIKRKPKISQHDKKD